MEFLSGRFGKGRGLLAYDILHDSIRIILVPCISGTLGLRKVNRSEEGVFAWGWEAYHSAFCVAKSANLLSLFIFYFFIYFLCFPRKVAKRVRS